MEITVEMIMSVMTAIMTYVFGLLSKKFNWIDSKYIPIQNAIIGIITGILCYLLKLSETDAITTIVYCVIGAMASGGTYDLAKVRKEEEE